jgi:transposase
VQCASTAADALLSLHFTNPPSTPPKPPRTFTGRFETGHASPPRRSLIDRYRMIIYREDGMTQEQISNKLHCSRNTVRRWLSSFRLRHTVTELPRRSAGRKRLIDHSMADEIVEYVKKSKFITPREVRLVFELDNVSNRTIDRLLREHGLFGRVARRHHPNMDPKKRLSFAEGNNH